MRYMTSVGNGIEINRAQVANFERVTGLTLTVMNDEPSQTDEPDWQQLYLDKVYEDALSDLGME